MSENCELFPSDLGTTIPMESSFLLVSLELYNWGPFQGKHSCDFDSGGSAIVGPTGSGKTTLVDALMTLLAPFPKYNLASTGGHDSDRDLISYVRGVCGTESAGGENDHVSRAGKTLTGLAATYRDTQQQICIGAILWVESSSNAPDDLRKTWFFSKDIGQPLDDLLRLQYEGGKQAVTRYARETVGLRLFGSKKEYLSHLRLFFEVGENAFSLLNRAAGLKQINSIDIIFRELVLDDRSAFDRALEVAAEFDNLQAIYHELETARRQRDSLLPVSAQQTALEAIQATLLSRQKLKALLPIWLADIAVNLWEAEVQLIGERIESTQQELKTREDEANRLRILVDALKEKYLQLGGATIQDIMGNLATKQQLADVIRGKLDNYQTCIRQLGMPDTLSKDVFLSNFSRLPDRAISTKVEFANAHESTLEIETSLRDNKLKIEELENELLEVKQRPHSNIPPHFQTFREALSAHLGISASQLPFVAELIKVKDDELIWRGAIERAIGSERMRILVPNDRRSDALSWVNQRDNRLHVRLQIVEHSPPSPKFFADGFVRKLDFRDHRFREAVQHLLSQRDRHCVRSINELQHVNHGMTAEGTMSDRDGRFEKQDQRPLSDGWMTGFDNSHQLNALSNHISEVRNAIKNLQIEANKRRGLEEVLGQKLIMMEQLQRLSFEEIDLPRIEREIDELRKRLKSLTMPDSDTAKAKSEYDAELEHLKTIAACISSLTKMLGGQETALKSAEENLRRAREFRGEGVNAEDAILCATEFPVAELISVNKLAEIEREAFKHIEKKIERSEEQKSETERRLIRAMEGAKREDTGALAETGTELRDVPDYLKQLHILQEEALPEKLKRFLEYLNLSSGQGVTQLLAHIENEVSMIVERIVDLNATLSRVDFRPGHYLQLQPERTVHESLRQIDIAHKKLRHAAVKAADDDGETHYRALGEVIRLIREAADNRRTLGAQALLDPRHRLQFFVVEMDRSTGKAHGRRTGSQTGSGGEKEMMASYILTASLSYALCPPGSTRPRYATIVLDEAFSKSSPVAASRIIDALRIFGLHPLFVTPNKEIALLKANTRSAILVHTKDRRATLTSLTWQQIEAHERSTAAQQ